MSAARISDASVLVYPRPRDAVAAIEAWRAEIRAACRRQVDDAADTEERAAISGAQAEAVLAHTSGEHRLDLPALLPCPDHDPADPRCQACLAAMRGAR